MNQRNATPEGLTEDMLALVASRKTLQLATVNQEGDALASYAPFVPGDNGDFFVFLSELAAHTRNLTLHPQASLLLIEDECEASNLFARRRVSLSCTARRLGRADQTFPITMMKFRQRFDAVIDTLIELPDFDLFVLVPTQGTFIRGFGEAYPVAEGRVLSADPRRPTALK